MTTDTTGGVGPVATVVVTTHNRHGFARRAVSSALAQTIADVEVVIVDDGSEPAFTFGGDDARVTVVRRARAGGMCAARNEGIAVARGRWITFLDDDDELAPDMLERSLAVVEQSTLPAPVAAMAALSVVAPDGTDLEYVAPLTVQRGEHCFLEGRGDFRAKNSLVVPTDLVRAIGAWDERLADWDADDFGIRLNRVASMQGFDEPLYRLTQHDGVRASRKWGGIAQNMEATLEKHAAVFAQHRALHAAYVSRVGFYHLEAGSWRAAIAWTARGLRIDPRPLRHWVFLGAALGGPRALGAYRRLRPRSIDVPFSTLMSSRVRKYARRAADYPRAVVGAPVAAVTGALVRRRAGLAPAGRHVLVLCIYRALNAARVAPLLAEALTRGWDVRLWALDAVAPSLAAQTVGMGAGPKFPLLNRLTSGLDLERYDWVVVSDDDVALDHGAVDELLAVAEAAGLDFVQPAHTERSHRENAITVRRPLSVARRTTFVEIGPVFAVRRPWASRVVPFPDDHGMGWGLELEWFDLERSGARLGIVDAVALRHLDPVGKGYAKVEELDRLRSRLDARGLSDMADVQQTLATWRPWQRRPAWVGRR
jgi:glycosyltransferase involved in cell wall biosynthesis